MPTICKHVTSAQFAAFTEACRRAGFSRQAVLDQAFADFCYAQHVAWPPTAPHGGDRRSAEAIRDAFPGRGGYLCPRCGRAMFPAREAGLFACECGLWVRPATREAFDYEPDETGRYHKVIRDHGNPGIPMIGDD